MKKGVPTKLCPLPSLLISTQYWNIVFHLVLYALLAPIYYSSPMSTQVLGLCSYYLEFPFLGYSKQFYHILFSPPNQNLLQSSFSAFLVPHPTPAQRLRFSRSIADIMRFTNSFTYLLTYLLTSSTPLRAILYINFVALLPLKLCVNFEWPIVNGSRSKFRGV